MVLVFSRATIFLPWLAIFCLCDGPFRGSASGISGCELLGMVYRSTSRGSSQKCHPASPKTPDIIASRTCLIGSVPYISLSWNPKMIIPTYIELGVALGASLDGLLARLPVFSSSFACSRCITTWGCGSAEKAGGGPKGGAADEGRHGVTNWGAVCGNWGGRAAEGGSGGVVLLVTSEVRSGSGSMGCQELTSKRRAHRRNG